MTLLSVKSDKIRITESDCDSDAKVYADLLQTHCNIIRATMADILILYNLWNKTWALAMSIKQLRATTEKEFGSQLFLQTPVTFINE